MTLEQLLEGLGYLGSPYFLTHDQGEFSRPTAYSHVFRKATQSCALRGVYTLSDRALQTSSCLVPVVYVCQTASREEADAIHRRVWNQGVVPFLVVQTRSQVRFYSGFRYAPAGPDPSQDLRRRGVLEAAAELNEAIEKLGALHADAINDGRVWEKFGRDLSLDTRVNWRLLEHLRQLDRWLCESGADPAFSHALIGKFVYLRYLRDREILSDRKLRRWGIDPGAVFSRNAQPSAFHKLVDRLDEWLNGAVFPLDSNHLDSMDRDDLGRVAGVFSGDDPVSGQLHLDFEPYDFSHIPIETLSVIYEQFLHSEQDQENESRGKRMGAYYTPIPLVNFILGELSTYRPLQEGMKVLDPSCGSGAFLVQCFRQLVERQCRSDGRFDLSPGDLRRLLENHIFGVDSDAEACRVAELSLILTLLDYVQPPDLENAPGFKLPALHDRNVFHADFFGSGSAWSRAAANVSFDWVVGNPPWKELKSSDLGPSEEHAWHWMQSQKEVCPTSRNQLAEAFAWRVRSHMGNEAVVGMLLPAMSLFKTHGKAFRQAFFRKVKVRCVANFANLRHILFAGRSRAPAAALFYGGRSAPGAQSPETPYEPDNAELANERIATYTPFAANQAANRVRSGKRSGDVWSIVVNASEVGEVPTVRAASGGALVWKMAMWATHQDERTIQRLTTTFPSFEQFATEHGLVFAEGCQFRTLSEGEDTAGEKKESEKTEFRPELVGKQKLLFRKLRRFHHLFSLPRDALEQIGPDEAHLRLRGGRRGLDVSRPPHVIVDACRRFAVFTDRFVVVPPRQAGIAGEAQQRDLLRALSLFLSSDFCKYHQFLISPEWGVRTTRTTLSALRRLPVPSGLLHPDNQRHLLSLHNELVQLEREQPSEETALSPNPPRTKLSGLLHKLNHQIGTILGLDDRERALVADFANTRARLAEGGLGNEVLGRPRHAELAEYLATLRSELDAFVADQHEARHSLTLVHDGHSAMIQVAFQADGEHTGEPAILRAGSATEREFQHIRTSLRQEHPERSQWMYFDRSLRIYKGTSTYLFKPMRRMMWTRTQAIADAEEIIVETLDLSGSN